MRYLTIDGALSGTGIRDKYNGGYFRPDDLGLCKKTIDKLKDWLRRYENEHYNNFENKELNKLLDLEGIELARIIKNELTSIKMEYFSNAYMQKEKI